MLVGWKKNRKFGIISPKRKLLQIFAYKNTAYRVTSVNVLEILTNPNTEIMVIVAAFYPKQLLVRSTEDKPVALRRKVLGANR